VKAGVHWIGLERKEGRKDDCAMRDSRARRRGPICKGGLAGEGRGQRLD
jgi:hypothetical protein